MIAETLSAWATSLGIEARTLERKLVKAGFTSPKPNSKIPAKKIMVAIVGDESAEKNRLLKAQADAQERENRTADENWGQWPEIEKLYTEMVVIPIREALLSVVSLAIKCNPGNPEIARAVLEQWRNDLLRLCAEAVAKRRKTK